MQAFPGHTLNIISMNIMTMMDVVSTGVNQTINRCDMKNLKPDFNHDKPAEKWNTAYLIDYIVQNHHRYTRETIPEIRGLLETVLRVHGEDLLNLAHVRDAFNDLADKLNRHMLKEEHSVFPAIRKVVRNIDHPLTITIQNPLADMESEHTHAIATMKEIRVLTEQYTPPDYACPTFRLCYQRLKEFETDLNAHIQLERNALFKRIQVEA